MRSISTRTPLGSAATCTVERAGGALGKRLPYTSLTAAKSFRSARKMVAFTTVAQLGRKRRRDRRPIRPWFEPGAEHDQPARGAIGLQVHSRRQPIALQERQHVSAPAPLRRRHEDLESVVEPEQARGPWPEPDD